MITQVVDLDNAHQPMAGRRKLKDLIVGHLHNNRKLHLYALVEPVVFGKEVLLGYLAYVLVDGSPHIDWVVSSGKKRGVGKALLHRLCSMFPCSHMSAVIYIDLTSKRHWLAKAQLNLFFECGFRVTASEVCGGTGDQQLGLQMRRWPGVPF